MPGGVVGGLVVLALIVCAISAGLWLVFNSSRVETLAVRTARGARLLPPLPPVPWGMPIERIAADLRRIRPEASRPRTDMPMARRIAILAAYDEALVDACRAVDVPTQLDLISDPQERTRERLRTETELQRAGVDLGLT
jgi:hypothetical protein